MTRSLLPALLLCACLPAPEGDSGDAAYINLVAAIPPLAQGDVLLLGPVFQVASGTEAQVCNFGTYDGPDVGLVRAREYVDRVVTHHTSLNAVPDGLYADGEVVDCLDLDGGQMPAYGPLFDGSGPSLPEDFQAPGPDLVVEYFDTDVAQVSMINLPDGVAFPLRSGQRWSFDHHIVNYYEEPARVQGGYLLGTIPSDEVQAWAGAGMLDSNPFDLPPGQSELTFDCPMPDDLSLLNLSPHMHQYGAAFSVELVRVDGSSELLLEVPAWSPEMRDEQPSAYFEPGTMELAADDVLRTTCSWDNPTGEWLPYPAEMCTTNLVAYPLEEGFLCFANQG